MASKFGARFDLVLRHFRKNFAPNCGLPIYIRTVKRLQSDGHSCWGTVDFYPGSHWLIKLDKGQSYSHAIECLAHEWAHIIHSEKYGWYDELTEQHPDEWGAIYSQLYRFYHEVLNDTRNRRTGSKCVETHKRKQVRGSKVLEGESVGGVECG